MISRRGFLGLLVATPLVRAVPALAKALHTTPPANLPLERGAIFCGEGGCVYQQVRAPYTVRKGDVTWWDGQVVGVATCQIDRGQYGFIQIGGPCQVTVQP